MRSQLSTRYDAHGIDPRYDDQAAYGPRDSFYGEGKYPPDWDARRDAVWERQRYRCGRCGRYKGDSPVNHVHHVVHLSRGGSNALDNLVGLCGDCHALMHPDLESIPGDPERAPVFPHEHANELVAVVRRPADVEADADLAVDLERLEATSEPDANAHAVTAAVVPTGAAAAKRAGSDLYGLLVEEGYVPRTSAYHRVSLVPRFRGLRGAITSHRPDVTVEGNGALVEREWFGGSRRCDIYYTPDTSWTAIELVDGLGETSEDRLRLTDCAEGSRFRLERTLEPPPLTLRTAPRYAVDAVGYVGWRALALGAMVAGALALGAPVPAPAEHPIPLEGPFPLEGSVAGLLVVAVLVAVAIRAPWILRDCYRALRPLGDRTVNERDESVAK